MSLTPLTLMRIWINRLVLPQCHLFNHLFNMFLNTLLFRELNSWDWWGGLHTCSLAWLINPNTFSSWGLLIRAPIRVLSSRGSPTGMALVLLTTSSRNRGMISLCTNTLVPLQQTCTFKRQKSPEIDPGSGWGKQQQPKDDSSFPAHLPLRQEVSHERPLHCVLQLAVFEDNEGRLPSELQGHLLHPLCRHFHDLRGKHRCSVLTLTHQQLFLHTATVKRKSYVFHLTCLCIGAQLDKFRLIIF